MNIRNIYDYQSMDSNIRRQNITILKNLRNHYKEQNELSCQYNKSLKTTTESKVLRKLDSKI